MKCPYLCEKLLTKWVSIDEKPTSVFLFLFKDKKDLFLGIQILYFDAKIEIFIESIKKYYKNNNKLCQNVEYTWQNFINK